VTWTFLTDATGPP